MSDSVGIPPEDLARQREVDRFDRCVKAHWRMNLIYMLVIVGIIVAAYLIWRATQRN